MAGVLAPLFVVNLVHVLLAVFSVIEFLKVACRRHALAMTSFSSHRTKVVMWTLGTLAALLTLALSITAEAFAIAAREAQGPSSLFSWSIWGPILTLVIIAGAVFAGASVIQWYTIRRRGFKRLFHGSCTSFVISVLRACRLNVSHVSPYDTTFRIRGMDGAGCWHDDSDLGMPAWLGGCDSKVAYQGIRSEVKPAHGRGQAAIMRLAEV